MTLHRQAEGGRETVVLVAPYSPELPMLNLGASKKIQLIARQLDRLGFDIHYVDSAHPCERFTAPIMGQATHIEGTPVTLWRPFCTPSRKAGKLLNIFTSGALFKRLASLKPDLVWIYNSYAFEARLGLHLQRVTGAKLIFELEDLPTSRGRGLNPKPLLDQHYFAPLLRQADLVTFVNAVLLNRHRGEIKQGLLFPSILQQALVDHPVPERFQRKPYRVGYFGGLEIDKGVGMLLALPEQMPPDWTLVITGVGPLTDDLKALAASHPGKVEFHGGVTHNKVRELMMGCDAIVNPHACIAGMQDGVFPFKVCEALATGAVLITTALPSIGLDLDRGVRSFDGSVSGLAQALQGAAQHYAQRREGIHHLRQQVCAQYGENRVLEQLKSAVDALFMAQGQQAPAASTIAPHRS